MILGISFPFSGTSATKAKKRKEKQINKYYSKQKKKKDANYPGCRDDKRNRNLNRNRITFAFIPFQLLDLPLIIRNHAVL